MWPELFGERHKWEINQFPRDEKMKDSQLCQVGKKKLQFARLLLVGYKKYSDLIGLKSCSKDLDLAPALNIHEIRHYTVI